MKIRWLGVVVLLSLTAGGFAQREQQAPARDEDAYGSKFFDQLRTIFGRFRDADLQRAFQKAEPIQCSELVINKGEWRTVAFVNEDRSLGEWCRNTLEEVKGDLSVYTFKGVCKGDQGGLRVVTEFPISASADAYSAGKIELDQVDINVNAPASVTFDIPTQAYIFELPYLFLVGRRDSGNIYSLVAKSRGDSYVADVTSRWECKAVKSDDLTYRFLICRTATVGRSALGKTRSREMGFGASAYFILSDGVEANTSVKISFASAGRPGEEPRTPPSAATTDARPAATAAKAVTAYGVWQMPDIRSRLVDVAKLDFRIRFSSQTWTGKLGTPQFLSDQKLLVARPQGGDDYCAWRPETGSATDHLLGNEPDVDVSYFLTALDKKSDSATSIVLEMKTHSDKRLGSLQCFFPGAASAANIAFDSWVAVVGAHLALEIRRWPGQP